MSNLPPELLEVLNQAYFLHLLATDPAKVVPPGKSLLSVMVRSLPDSEHSALHAEVKKVFHNAFWDEALLSLSSMSPAVQLSRLKFLYRDLDEVLAPLFPPDHPLLQTLAAPLPPTSSPLHSTITLLKDILTGLRQRCAPVRDPEIDDLLANLASSPEPFQTEIVPEKLSSSPLATLIVSTIRSILELADTLKRDLTNTVLGAMSETQLASVVRQQAYARERELVLDGRMWGGMEGFKSGVEFAKAEWTAWLGTQPGDAGWITRLLRALASPTPVTCRPFNRDPNPLPLQFFFSRPSLFRIQNYLQALVIVASLKALVRPLPSSQDSSSVLSPLDLVPRVWSLLTTDIDAEDRSIQDVGVTLEVVASHTKLVNLADEAVRAQRTFISLSEAEEVKLRTSVERTLRLEDPVFILLQGRLIRAIERQIVEALRSTDRDVASSEFKLPEKMKTGRGVVGVGQPIIINGVGNRGYHKSSKTPLVKGFEDEVLGKGIEEAVDQVLACISWVENVWGDTISEPSASME